MNKPQSAMQRYLEIMKYHGVLRGCRRVVDQIFQVDIYDVLNSTNTGQILSGNEFWSSLGSGDSAAVMHYQPVYTAAVKKPLQYLVRHFPVVGASSTCFLDLGCGRGKALHVAKTVMQHATLIGIDLHRGLLEDAAKNLGVGGQIDGAALKETTPGSFYAGPKVKLFCENVNDAAYPSFLPPFDAVIVFNKNSFDKATTENTLDRIRKCTAGKSVFYVYSNPVFEGLFKQFDCVFEMSGWHKNWNTKVYQIS